VTYRLVRRLPSARRPAVFRAIRRAFNEGREAFGGRLCHFSVQRDHLHLVVEAANREALSRALHALAIRIARAINRALGRKGRVFADRYHLRILKTPTGVLGIGTDAAPSIRQTSLAALNRNPLGKRAIRAFRASGVLSWSQSRCTWPSVSASSCAPCAGSMGGRLATASA